MCSRVRDALGVAGIVATALGIVAVTRPTLVTETEPLATLVGLFSAVRPRDLLTAGGIVAVLALVVSAVGPRDRRLVSGDRSNAARFDRRVEESPETAATDDSHLTASAFDSSVDRATAGDDRALEQVCERLRTLAVARLGRGDHDRDVGAAERAVDAGTWTGDRTAAAFLSGADGPSFPTRSRLRHWLDPERERARRIRRAVAAVEALDDPDTGDSGDTDGETDR